MKDKTEFCSQWKRHGACELDRDFTLSEEDDLNAQVYSKQMFDLMQKTCPKTCGWVESGCHDEHPRCPEWARSGLCTVNYNPSFMAHTCRESCGVCGLLSLHNMVSIQTSPCLEFSKISTQEIQRKEGMSYTDFFNEDDFECGRFKPLTEINQDGAEVAEVEDENVFCGATIINDRWTMIIIKMMIMMMITTGG